MRNLSYMGRVVVKLIIIAVIAFIVITTAVFIINKYKSVKRADSGTSPAVSSQNKKPEDKTVTTLPGAVADSNKLGDKSSSSSNSGSDKSKSATEKDKAASETTKSTTQAQKSTTETQKNSETSKSSSGTGVSSTQLPKTGPADVVVSVFAVATLAFSASAYMVSRRAI